MRRGERGSAALEYAGLVAMAAALVVALAVSGAAERVASVLRASICRITSSAPCPEGTGEDGGPRAGASLEERIDGLEASAERRRRLLRIESPEAAGSRFAELHEQIRRAIGRGQVEKAEELDAMLEMYVRLARGENLEGSDRGAVLEDLWLSDAKWRQAVEQGTIYLPPNGDNLRYFDIPKAPGDGLVVMDYFIPFKTSGPAPVKLKGDDRDFHPGGPLAADLPLDASRVVVMLDRETGRGAIYQSHTCNEFYDQCREARPIALDMDERTQSVPELSNDVSGPYIAPTNRFEVAGDAESIRLRYDALNSMTWPVFAVEGTVELTGDGEGRYGITEDDRDRYPSIGIYQYRPGQEPYVIQERDSEPVMEGATDKEWLPWGPGD